jgi:hypothetical protein
LRDSALPLAVLLTAALAACQVTRGPISVPSPSGAAAIPAIAQPTGTTAIGQMDTDLTQTDDLPRGTPGALSPTAPLPIREVENRCPQDSLPPAAKAALEGRILAVDAIQNDPLFHIHALEAGTDAIIPVPYEISSEWFSTSPGYSHLAYLSYPGLAVLDTRLQAVTTVGLQFAESYAWLDESRLATYSVEDPPVRMRIWDIATGAFTRASFEFPRYWVPFDDWVYGRWGAVFSRDLEQAVYAYGDPVIEGVALWSIREAKSLWSIERWSVATITPSWDPSSERVAVAAVDSPHVLELFIVHKSGRSQQWVKANVEPDIDGAVFGVSWSPDGRYVALAAIGGAPLFILDTEARSLLEYCVRVDTSLSDLVWSPHGTHLIVPNGYEGALVLDMADGSALPLFDDAELVPVAWLP